MTKPLALLPIPASGMRSALEIVRGAIMCSVESLPKNPTSKDTVVMQGSAEHPLLCADCGKEPREDGTLCWTCSKVMADLRLDKTGPREVQNKRRIG